MGVCVPPSPKRKPKQKYNKQFEFIVLCSQRNRKLFLIPPVNLRDDTSRGPVRNEKGLNFLRIPNILKTKYICKDSVNIHCQTKM